MKFTGTKKVKLSSLNLPGDISKRRRSAHVRELAASIKAHGLAHLPVIAGKEPVVGRDRLAALLELGEKTAEVRTAEGTPEELEALEIAENLHRRRDDQDELRKRYVALMERHFDALPINDPEDRQFGKPGRPPTARSKAIRAAAEAEGVEPAAIRKSLARAAEDEVHTHQFVGFEGEDARCACGAVDVAIAPPVDTWDVPVDHLAQEFAQVRIAQAAIDETDRHLRAAQRALSALRPEMSDLGTVTSAVYARIYHQLHQVADEVRRSRPDVLCVYCKGLAQRRGTCGGCLNLGYMSKDALEHIAPELLKRGDEAVVVNGRGGFETLAQACKKGQVEPDGSPSAKGKKRIRIEDEEGNDLAYREGEDLF